LSSPPDKTKGTLFIVSAPSGAGKTSLVKALIASLDNVVVSVSHTTRPSRPGEVDGVNYHFVDEETFLKLRSEDGFFEWAEVFGNLYGTAKAGIDDQLARGIDVILEIDWQGALQIRAQRNDTVSLFILPPSTATLRQRLTARGQDNDEIIEKRMFAAKAELAHYNEADFLVLNDIFERALEDLQSIVRACRLKQEKQSKNLQSTLSDLLSD
jgi:guanylate kinase